MTTTPATETPSHQHAQGFCTIVPPYVLEAMARSDEPAVARHAREALVHDETMRRARREARAAGTTRRRRATAHGAGPHRTISDAHGQQVTPGGAVRAEGAGPVGDAAADEAYDGLGATWSLWHEAFGRDSLDGKGLPLLATVHYGASYDNAFWDGTQMVFGDGDGVVFQRFTRSLDVIGHELAHGVTEHTAGLLYQGQSGALNESVSDVFGSLVKQHSLGQDAAAADWLVGAELLAEGVKGRALRDMREPGTAYDDPRLGKDPQPGHMDDYVDTDDDNGGVHINSGIPNRAFVLAALAIGGRAWEGAGRIWFAALTGDGIKADCDFATFAALTVAAAEAGHGAGSSQAGAVRSAWEQVGVLAAGDAGADGAAGSAAGAADGSAPAPPRADAPGPGARLRLRRTGGFAGLVAERETTLGELPEHDGRDWRHLLAAPTLQRIAATTERSHPDAYTYTVVCDEVGCDVVVQEPHLPEAIHSLFERTLAER